MLSVVVPMWNEEAGAARAIEAIVLALAEATRHGSIGAFEIVAVDDGSTDGTRSVLGEIARSDPRLRVIAHQCNRGLGAAVRSGLAGSVGDPVLYTDADLPCEPAEIIKAIRIMDHYGADIVSAYRHDRAGEGLRRTVYSLAWNAGMRVGFGLRARDVNFAFKLIRRTVLDSVPLTAEGSFIDGELLVGAQRQGFKIVQFGVDYFPRTRGTSTLSSWSTIIAMVREAIRFALRARQ